MNSKILTTHETNDLLDIIHSLVFIKDVDKINRAAYSLKELLEYDFIIFGLPESRSHKSLAVNDLNINYPKDWVSLYQENEFWRIDPVVLATRENGNPQHWGDIYRKFPPDKNFIGLAHDFGVKDGWTCLTRGGQGLPWTIISTGGDVKKNKHNKKREEFILQRISPHFHIALSSLKVKSEIIKPQSPLTKREKEVLLWISQGKTSWETSVILSIAEVTVNFHVKNIKAKLNTVSRSHAVAIATHSHLMSTY